MPSIFLPSFCAIASTVGWSITIAATSSTFWSPTCSVLIFASPTVPNSGMNPLFLPESSFASFATLLLSSDIGAPVSKISANGPLPLIFTCTVMWPDFNSSNGTVTGLASALVSARVTATTATASSVEQRIVRMSDALAGGECDLLRLLAALDGQADLLARGRRPRQPQHIVHVRDRAPVDLRHDVAGQQAALGR